MYSYNYYICIMVDLKPDLYGLRESSGELDLDMQQHWLTKLGQLVLYYHRLSYDKVFPRSDKASCCRPYTV